MDLIVLIGSGAVGKMTVGQELMKITDFRLFHNHMTIEPVIELFGRRVSPLVNKLREDIFEAFLQSDFQGMIFTYMWAFDMQEDWDYIKYVADKFEATGGTVYYVELVADRAVRLERNKTENRLLHKASKRDTVLSDDRILREETKYRVESREGELPFPNYLRIDNTNLEPNVVAKMIKEHFNLPGPNPERIVDQVYFDPVRDDELEMLHKMQVESFMPLYEVYRDECSPAIESIDRIKKRAKVANRKYYFICVAGARVGVINIGHNDPNEHEISYISPIFILPRYQNRGYGYAAIMRAFAEHPEVKTWRLETIKQEPRNCHLYEKCGFVPTGVEETVNDKMTLIMYERSVPGTGALYMIRHGRTDWNDRKRLQGQTDIPLNDAGRAMAAEAAARCKDVAFDVCFCSPLSRARETAEILLKGRDVPVYYDDRLKEMAFGEYEGVAESFKIPDCPVNSFFFHPEEYTEAVPGGENVNELLGRTGEFYEERVVPLLKEGKAVLVVGHGAMNMSLICNVRKLPTKDFWKTGIENCRLIKLL